MAKHNRSGDVNLRPIAKLPKNLKEVKHNGYFITAKGEATGSVHTLVADKKQDMFIGQNEKGNYYFQFFAQVKHTHTRDHETTFVMPGIYKQVPEREVDWFEHGVVRKVID